MKGTEAALEFQKNHKKGGCDHIYYEFKSDITVLSKGEVRTSKCLKCGDLKVG